MATYATLTVPVADIIGAEFNTSRASVWIEPNTPVVLADSIRVGGRREQVTGGVATFTNLVTTDSADNPTTFGYRVTITAPPKGAARREDIVTLTTSDFPLTATANLKDIPEAWDNIVLPVAWRSAFRDEMEALQNASASALADAQALVVSDLGTTDGQTRALIEAPASQTAVALSATNGRVLPESHGATGNNSTNNRAAIQAAINAATAGQTVWFNPAKTYVVGGFAAGDGLTLKSGVKLAGGGTLKVASGVGDYSAILRGHNVTDVTISDLIIDANGSGNPIVTAPPPGGRFAIYTTGTVTDLTVRGVTIKNHTSVNTIAVSGSDSQRVTVTGCRFLNIGADTTEGFDHSTLYIQARKAIITDNYFEGGSPLGAHAAIETHAPACTVTGNVVEGYGILANITGVQPWDGNNMVVTGNVGRKVMIGFALYSHSAEGGPNPGIRNLVLAHNTVELDRDYHLPFASETQISVPMGVYIAANSDQAIENVDISHNLIHFSAYSTAPLGDESAAGGIVLWRTTTPASPDLNVRIESNTIINAPGPGIRYSAPTTGANGACRRLRIAANTIINPGGSASGSTPAPYKSGVILTNGAWQDVELLDNLIVDDRATHKMTGGIDVSTIASVANGRTVGNVTRCGDGTALAGFAPAGGTGKAFFVDGEVDTWLGIFSPVKPGSRIRERSSGKVFINTETADGTAPSWVSMRPGAIGVGPAQYAATFSALPATPDKKLAIWDESGSSLLGWVPVYTSLS